MTAITMTPAAQENRYLGEILGKHMPEAAERTAFLNLCLEDGTRIGSHVPFVKAHVSFVKAMVEAACAWASDSLNCPHRRNGLRRA